MAYTYRHRSPFLQLLKSAEYSLVDIDAFFEFAKKAKRSEQKNLEQIAAISGENVSDGDQWGDDVPQLKEFAWLYSEFAIIGLWRCIELYEGRSKKYIRSLHKQSAIRAALDIIIKDEDKKISCAQSVNELRCLNNAIKHGRRVSEKLAEFPLWKHKKGDELGDLERHYLRLRPFAKRYLENLTKRLNNAKIPSLSPAGQVSKP